MPLLTADIAVSMDGVAAGRDQSAEHPMGAPRSVSACTTG
jgi:hypothetical protein